MKATAKSEKQETQTAGSLIAHKTRPVQPIALLGSVMIATILLFQNCGSPSGPSDLASLDERQVQEDDVSLGLVTEMDGDASALGKKPKSTPAPPLPMLAADRAELDRRIADRAPIEVSFARPVPSSGSTYSGSSVIPGPSYIFSEGAVQLSRQNASLWISASPVTVYRVSSAGEWVHAEQGAYRLDQTVEKAIDVGGLPAVSMSGPGVVCSSEPRGFFIAHVCRVTRRLTPNQVNLGERANEIDIHYEVDFIQPADPNRKLTAGQEQLIKGLSVRIRIKSVPGTKPKYSPSVDIGSERFIN
jgi:hypothetical protein